MNKLDAKLKTFLLTDNISILINNYSKKYNIVCPKPFFLYPESLFSQFRKYL